MAEQKPYGYVVEILNKFITRKSILSRKYLGEEWWRYNRKIYDTEEIAKQAIEENPHYIWCQKRKNEKNWNGFMAGYRILPVYLETEEGD